MSDEIYFDGTRYVSVNEAASFAGLSRDYVGRLCKEGKVLGKRIGKQWYVSRDSLGSFVLAQQYAHAKRREILAETRREEYVTGSIKSSSSSVPSTEEDIRKTLSAPTGRDISGLNPPRFSSDGVRHSYVQDTLRAAMARAPIHAHARAANLITTVPIHAVSLKEHVTHVLPPAMELLHKISAIVVAILFVAGTYVFVDAQYARVAERSSTLGSSLLTSARVNLAAAAEDPTGTLSRLFNEAALSLNRQVDRFVYNIMFGNLSENTDILSASDTGPRGAFVSARILPGKDSASSENTDSGAGQSASARTIAQSTVNTPTSLVTGNPTVIERVVETERIVSAAGGITEELLNARLNQLDNKLSSQMYGISAQSSSNAAHITNVYNEVAQSQRIDQLSNIRLTNPTISGGTISGISIGGSSITGDINIGSATVTALAVTGSATSTFANGLSLTGGCVSVNGTCLSASGASLSVANTWTALQLFSAGASTTQLSVFDRLYVGGSATTTIRGDNVASTIPFASSTAITVSGTGYFGTASTTNLTVSGIQNSILSTNATGITQAAAIGNGLSLSSNTLSTSFSTTTTNTWTALQTIQFASSTALAVSGTGYFGTASSTNLITQYASSSVLTVDRNAYFTNLTSALLGTDSTGKLVSTTTIGNSLLTNGGALTVNTSGPLGGGGSVALGGALTLTCTTCSTASDPFTHTPYAGLTTSATTSAFRTTSLLAASTTDFTYASTTQLTTSGNTYLTGLTSKLLATDSTGLVVGTTTIGNSLLTNGGAFTINSDGFLTGGGTLSLGGTLTLNASTSPTVGYLFATSTRASSLLYASSTALTATSLFGTNALLTGSTTIGGGSTTTGLTILGGATTTGTLVVQGTATSTFSSGLSATYLNITGTIATSTFANGLALTSGCVTVNGTCLGTGSGTVGSGTAGQFAYFASAGTTLSGTSTIYLSSNERVGIGTTSPQSKFEIVNTSSGATADALFLSNLASATSTASRLTFRTDDLVHNTGTSTAAITSILQQNFNAGKGDLAFSTLQSGTLTEVFRATSLGYLGIGTTTPFRRLSVTDGGSSAPQLALGFNTSNDAQMMVDSTGALSIAASGNQVRLNNDNFWVCTGGSATTNGCPTGNPSGQGNLVIENRLGIGTSTLGVSGANYAFTIDLQNDSTTNLLSISTSTSGYGTTYSLFTVNSAGKVGVATSSPWSRFTVGAGGAITTVENALTDAATITVDWLMGNQQRVTLAGNRTINFSNYISGQILRLVVCQDSTGSRTVTWGAVNWQGGSAPTLTTTAGKCDLATFVATYATSSASVQVFGATALNF